ncbi:MAG: Hint domain-containing protein [Pseudomonadota bacterium]
MPTSFLATGADVVSNAQTSFNTNRPPSDGDLTLNGGSQPFADDAIIEFFATGEDANGELGGGSAFTGFKVYASQADYDAGIVQFDYQPQNPGQTGTVQGDGSGVGDCYISFNNVFVSSDAGAPSLSGRIFVAPGTDAANQIGSFATARFMDVDFNNDGDFDDPNEAGNGKFSPQKSVPICFGADTLIATERGQVRMADLAVGDRVFTRDNGLQVIRWIGGRALSPLELLQNSHLRPVVIRKGALGRDLPERDLTVSPNHRMLWVSAQAQLYFNETEVLTSAKSLLPCAGVARGGTETVRYMHMLFDRHEVVLANGVWSESFLPSDYSVSGMDAATRAEVLELFPELATNPEATPFGAARRDLRPREMAVLLAQ